MKDPQDQLRCEKFSNYEIGLSFSWYKTYEEFLAENFQSLAAANVRLGIITSSPFFIPRAAKER